MTLQIARLGWRPDLPDFRDKKYACVNALALAGATLPANTDLRPACPPIWDQGNLGSCTSNSSDSMFWFIQIKEGFENFEPSRLFSYYNTRAVEGSIGQDSGGSLRDTLKVLAWKGVCHEALMPYDVAAFTKKPKVAAYTDAAKHKAVTYLSINQDANDLKTCLAEGYPFVFGFTVYDSMMSDEVAKTGIVPMPAKSETAQGGHAVMAVGYDDAKQMFIVRNSWGASWGMAGYFELPYKYILNSDLASDFWTLRTTEAPAAK